MKLLFLVVILFIVIPQTNYLKKYAGTYAIAPDDGVEIFKLYESGNASWFYRFGRGTSQVQTKSGKWSASIGYIKVSIQGNSGVIDEVFRLKNGKFVSDDDSNRYLIKKP